MKATHARLLATSLLVALGLALSCGSITKEELSCEQAVSKLSDCCPGLDTRSLPCVDSSGGCNGAASPTLTPRAATCVLDTECGAYQSGGACDRIIATSRVPNGLKDNVVLESDVCQ